MQWNNIDLKLLSTNFWKHGMFSDSTWLTSKLTEPLWSVSNALNRKCAYVEASMGESRHRNKELSNILPWLQLAAASSVDISAKLQRQFLLRMFFLHDERGEQCSQSYELQQCFLLGAPLYLQVSLSSHFTDISKPPQASSFVPRVDSLTFSLSLP